MQLFEITRSRHINLAHPFRLKIDNGGVSESTTSLNSPAVKIDGGVLKYLSYLGRNEIPVDDDAILDGFVQFPSVLAMYLPCVPVDMPSVPVHLPSLSVYLLSCVCICCASCASVVPPVQLLSLLEHMPSAPVHLPSLPVHLLSLPLDSTELDWTTRTPRPYYRLPASIIVMH